MAYARDKKPPTSLKPIGAIPASDEQYINEIVDSYRLHDLRQNPPPAPLTKAKRVFDRLRQKVDAAIEPSPPVAASQVSTLSPSRLAIPTHLVVDSLLKLKRHQRLRPTTLHTYQKRWRHFARAFELMPEELDPILDYLGQFDGETGRTKRDRQDLLSMLYQHAVDSFGMSKNPLEALPRPKVEKKPIRTLSLDQVLLMDVTPETLTQRGIWELLIGHGWRQIEVRRITAGDVRNINDSLIWCRGKERNEFTPILPETQALLEQLSDTLPDSEAIFRSRRVRNGRTQPLGEDGMSQLVGRLFNRAGISFKGHDLRRSFATLVKEASGDEFLAMRLIRDKIPGMNERYINFSMVRLREALESYSPLRLIKKAPALPGLGILVETGEGRTPRPEEAAQDMLQA